MQDYTLNSAMDDQGIVEKIMLIVECERGVKDEPRIYEKHRSIPFFFLAVLI
jgi:hypothetical protein